MRVQHRFHKAVSMAMAGLLFFSSVSVASAAVDNTVQARLQSVEVETYGTEQTGAFLDRVNKVEKDYLGKHNEGSLLERVNVVFDELYDNSIEPGLLTQLNAIEWGILHEVSSRPVDNRVRDMEIQIAGSSEDGTYAKRIVALGEYAFGGYEVPLEQVAVPADTLIKIALSEEVDARNIKAGDIVHYRVAEDVILDGMLVFAKGQAGEGVVESVKQARNFGRDAKININFHTTKAMDGTDVMTYVGEKAKEEMKSYAMAAGASLAGVVLLGPVGIIGGIFVKGKNIDYPAGTEMFIQTKDETILYAIPTKGE